MSKLPAITLDTTLAELYEKGRSPDTPDRIAMVQCIANSEVELSGGVARNTKYLYQESTFTKMSERLSPKNYKEVQRQTAVKYLSLIPQVGHCAFVNRHE